MKKVGAGAVSLCLVGSAAMAAAPAIINLTTPDAPEAVAYADSATQTASSAEMTGFFSADQEKVTPSSRIKEIFLKASTMCASMQIEVLNELSPEISVGGDVDNPVVATVDELADSEGTQRMILACACSTNDVNGDAVVNADVSGVSVEDIANLVGVR